MSGMKCDGVRVNKLEKILEFDITQCSDIDVNDDGTIRITGDQGANRYQENIFISSDGDVARTALLLGGDKPREITYSPLENSISEAKLEKAKEYILNSQK